MQVAPASFGVRVQRVQTPTSPPAATGGTGLLGQRVFQFSKRDVFFAGEKRKIMTYNMQDFYRTKNGKHQKSTAGRQALADVILKEDADVLCLQEAGDVDFMKDFNTRFLSGKYPNVYGSPVKNGRGVQNVVYMAKDGITLTSIKSHLKDICPPKPVTPPPVAKLAPVNGTRLTKAEKRAAREAAKQASKAARAAQQALAQAVADCGKRDIVEANFKTDTGYEFTLMNAHLKSMRGGEQLTMPKRMADATVIGKIIDALIAGDPDAHIMVVGDMNIHHQSQYGKPVFEELSRTTDNDPDNDMAETMLKDGKNEPTHNGGTLYGNNKLDYMFTSKAMTARVTDAYVAGQFSVAPWGNASDHRPVVTEIEEPDPPTAGQGNLSKPPQGTPAAVLTPTLQTGQQLNFVA